MYLRSLREHYPDTPAAEEVRTLIADAEDRLAATAAAGRAGVPLDEIERTLQIVEKALGDRPASLQADPRSSAWLGQAPAYWREPFDTTRPPGRLPGGSREEESRTRLWPSACPDRQAAKVKETLVASYLELGTIHVQRRSIPNAESYRQKACELDPENKANHDLHQLIQQEKTVYYGDSR